MGIQDRVETKITLQSLDLRQEFLQKITSYNSMLTISALLLLTLTVCASFPFSSTLIDISSEESSDLSQELVGRRYRRGVVIMKPPVRPVLKPFRIRNPYRTSHQRVLPRYPSYRGYGSPVRPHLKPFNIDYPSYRAYGPPVRPHLKPFDITYPKYG